MAVSVNHSVSGGGNGGSGSSSFATITGDPTDNAALVTWGDTLGGGTLSAIVLSGGAGTYNITHDDCNRGVSIADTGPQVDIVLPNIATDPTLLDGDFLTIDNYGPAILLMKGVVIDRAGMKRFVLPGEVLQALYRAASNTWISCTPVIYLKNGRSPSYSAAPIANSTSLTTGTVGVTFTQLDSSIAVAGAPGTDAYGKLVRVQSQGAAAAINRCAGLTSTTTLANSPFFVPTAAVPWEFVWRGAFSVFDAITDGRFFLGFGPVPTFNVEPSTFLNAFALYSDSDMTQLKLGYNDGAGAFTPVTLNGGTGFPSQTTGADVYELFTWWRSDGTKTYVYWRATNLITDVFDWGVYDCAALANFPAPGTQMIAQMWRNSGPNTATTPRGHWFGAFAGQFA
jgi:hypothetical protein